MKAGALATNIVHEAEIASLEVIEWWARRNLGPCQLCGTAISALDCHSCFILILYKGKKKQFLFSLNHHRFQFAFYSQPSLILEDTVLLGKHLWAPRMNGPFSQKCWAAKGNFMWARAIFFFSSHPTCSVYGRSLCDKVIYYRPEREDEFCLKNVWNRNCYLVASIEIPWSFREWNKSSRTTQNDGAAGHIPRVTKATDLMPWWDWSLLLISLLEDVGEI